MDNNVKKDAKIAYVTEIQKIAKVNYFEDRAKKALFSEKGIILVSEDDIKDFLNSLINKLNDGIEYCKKHFCTLSFGKLQNMLPEDSMDEPISVEMMPVKVTLNNETKIYVDVDVYVDDYYFIVGREYNQKHDANPSEGPEYNIIFSKDILANADKNK